MHEAGHFIQMFILASGSRMSKTKQHDAGSMQPFLLLVCITTCWKGTHLSDCITSPSILYIKTPESSCGNSILKANSNNFLQGPTSKHVTFDFQSHNSINVQLWNSKFLHEFRRTDCTQIIAFTPNPWGSRVDFLSGT